MSSYQVYFYYSGIVMNICVAGFILFLAAFFIVQGYRKWFGKKEEAAIKEMPATKVKYFMLSEVQAN